MPQCITQESESVLHISRVKAGIHTVGRVERVEGMEGGGWRGGRVGRGEGGEGGGWGGGEWEPPPSPFKNSNPPFKSAQVL